MLGELPDNVLQHLVEYLRSWEYHQEDLRQLSQVNRTLRRHALPHIWEYFAITDVVISGKTTLFMSIQPHLSRLLISDDELIPDDQWATVLAVLWQMDWSHIKMFSIELDSLYRKSFECVKRIMGFVHSKLDQVKEVWVALAEDPRVAELFFAKKYERLEDLRVIGTPVLMDTEWLRSRAWICMASAATLLTPIPEVVRRSHNTLRDLNIGLFSFDVAQKIGIAFGCRDQTEYPRLQRLAISNMEIEHIDGLIDGAVMPGLRVLYFSEATFPSANGHNLVAECTNTRLMASKWQVRCLCVDALSRADTELLGLRMPRLEFLSIGALGSDVELADTAVPSVPIDLKALGRVLDSCPTLVDLRIETPELYEDMYNAGLNNTEHKALAPPQFDRPFDPSIKHIANTHMNLLHMTLNSWALSFDQLLLLLDSLTNLHSFEGILRFTSRYPLTQNNTVKHHSLSHLSLAYNTASKHKHIFKSNLLKFVSVLDNLKTLDIYGNLDIPGLGNAVEHLVPGCTAGFYPLIPTWLLDAIDAENAKAELSE
ncbi:hypothetical protein BX070DRAFT_247834 [Coemansia spiralis]|nr:hypothetical protein BX070DRAFT_247834 [Coemansia spiralis]